MYNTLRRLDSDRHIPHFAFIFVLYYTRFHYFRAMSVLLTFTLPNCHLKALCLFIPRPSSWFSIDISQAKEDVA